MSAPGFIARASRLRPADLFEIVLAHLWRGLAIGVLAGLAVGYALLSAADIYEARSLLMYQLGRDYVYVPDATAAGSKMPDPGNLEPYVNAEMQILDSAAVRNALLDRLLADGVYTTTEMVDRQRLYERLDKAVSISLVTGSYIIDIRVRDMDPDRGARIARELVAVYQQQRVRMIAIDTPEFITQQIDLAKSRLTGIGSKIEALVGTPDPAAHDVAMAALLAQKSKTAADTILASAEVAGFKARIAGLERAASDLPVAERTIGNPTYDKLVATLTAARIDLAAALARQETLVAANAGQDAEFQRQTAKSGDLVSLRAARLADATMIEQLEVRLRDSLLTAARSAAGSGTVRVLDPGTVGAKPVGLPARLSQIAAVLVGVFAAALAVLLSELNAAGLYTADIARARLGLPVLGEIEDRRRLPAKLRKAKVA